MKTSVRAAAVVGFLACLTAGTRSARAQADGGAPTAVSPDGAAAPDAATAAPTEETGSGLFEQSQATGAAPGAPAAAAAPPFALDGYARGDVFVGKFPGAPRGQIKADYGELALAVRTKKEPYGDAFAEARVRYGLQGDEQQAFVDLREAYVNAYLGRFDLRLGQQIIVWGRADALNPTNNLTPVDFRIRSPLEDDIRLGNAGARAFLRLAPAPLRLEGVWMPVYLPTVLPPVLLPQYVTFGPPTFPTPDLTNGTEAARLHLELPSFEMSVSYLHGYALLPGITLASVTLTGVADPVTGVVTPGATPPSILVSRTAYLQQVIGLDFSTALGEAMTVRGEAAYRRPYDYRTAQYGQVAYPDLQYVLGADHNFGSVSVIAQYMGRYVFDWQKQNGPAAPLDPQSLLTQTMDDEGVVRGKITAQLQKTNQILFSQTAQLQHLATVRIEWLALHDTLSVSALGLVNFTTKEWAFTPRIGYRLSDALTAYLGAQIFKGPNDTLFGLIDEQLSVGYAELRFTF